MKRKTTIGRAILQQTVHGAKSRLIELQRQVDAEEPGSYRHQELAAERIDTARRRDIAAAQLESVDVPATLDPARAEMFERLVAERRETSLRFIQKLEREGDHRQARIWRLSLLDIPRQVMREL